MKILGVSWPAAAVLGQVDPTLPNCDRLMRVLPVHSLNLEDIVLGCKAVAIFVQSGHLHKIMKPFHLLSSGMGTFGCCGFALDEQMIA